MSETDTPSTADRTTLILRWIVGLLVLALLAVGAWYGYAYATTPDPIRRPQHAHYHFRMQIVVDGKPVDFSKPPYQEPQGTVCTAALAPDPIHFHDQLDQFVHIHWNHLTGGLILKNYGWNLVGGPSGALGYRFDQLPKLVRVPIQAAALPALPAGTRYYIYTGNEQGYILRDWQDFLHQDLRDFFKGGAKKTSFLDRFIPLASAHGGETHEKTEAELTKLNDVLGSAVIFAQKSPPTAQQIKNRFNRLVPLPESSCGG